MQYVAWRGGLLPLCFPVECRRSSAPYSTAAQAPSWPSFIKTVGMRWFSKLTSGFYRGEGVCVCVCLVSSVFLNSSSPLLFTEGILGVARGQSGM